jgi:hypothetical protein
VQGSPGAESAGYHGYWITDFTRVDPHFGTNQEFRTLVEAVHQRGMKLYLDIVVNHTADVIAYRECPSRTCPYRSKAEYPYQRRGGLHGEPINSGFLGDDAEHQTVENFAHLTRPDYAYTPYVPRGDERVKVPDWLNDPIYYHNRGNSTFSGESSTFGDFSGLDDLFTENPRVVQGFIDIYGAWIDAYGIDGFRIDTAKHVNPEFWQAFVPAMLARARARGIPHFHIFGEVSTSAADAVPLAVHTRVDRLPAVLDFAFAAAVRATVAGSREVRRRRGSCPRSSAITTKDGSLTSCAKRARESPPTRYCGGYCWRTPCFSRCVECRSCTTVMSRDLQVAVATRPRARTCSRARSRPTTASRCWARQTPRRTAASTASTRCIRRSHGSRACAKARPHCETEHSGCGPMPQRPGCLPFHALTRRAAASCSSPSTPRPLS